jgi:hypothetical protein
VTGFQTSARESGPIGKEGHSSQDAVARDFMAKGKDTMMRYFYRIVIVLGLIFATSPLMGVHRATAATTAEINRDVQSALQKLYTKSSSAKALGEKAKGILVFPGIVKGGSSILPSPTKRKPITF